MKYIPTSAIFRVTAMGLGKINARTEYGGIQRTHFYLKLRCVSDPVKLKDISHAHT